MPSPFPGMDPYLEQNPIFHELHTQLLAEAQALLQPQVRPKYVARLERHLSEGSVWGMDEGGLSLDKKEPDLTLITQATARLAKGSTAMLAKPTIRLTEDLDSDELEMRKQRRIVIYVQAKPRLAVTAIELLSPSNKAGGSIFQTRYLEKRSSALHGGLHWVEIDLLRGGTRPPMPLSIPGDADYLAYVAQATPKGWNHLAYTWGLREPLRSLPIPLLGTDEAELDLAACFRQAYDRVAADDEADYRAVPPPPALRKKDLVWAKELLKKHGLRK